MHAVEIESICKSFGSTRAVDDLSLKVPGGCIYGFIGPNGSGKTTTLRMILRIIHPDSGTIRVLGEDATTGNAANDRIGYLPEERGLYRKMRVADYLHYIARLKGIDAPEAKRRVADWLEKIQLPGVNRKKCQELSKGMQQKVQFLAAVIHEPDLIILDEPFSGLDPVNSALLNQLIRELHGLGRTIIFSTHVLHQAELICDRFFLINKGVKLLDATLAEIRARFDPRTIVAEPLNGAADFASIPGVVRAEPMPETGAWELELEGNADRQDVLRHIVARCSVRSVELRRLTMEEVFIRLVMADRGAEAARTAREELSRE